MQLTQDSSDAKYQIHAYKPGAIQVNDTVFTHSIIISATQLIEHWPPQILPELTREHFSEALALQPEILLLGTGAVLEFPPLELYGELLNQGIGVEVMDTSAACRTFTVLAAEGRNVVAALLIK